MLERSGTCHEGPRRVKGVTEGRDGVGNSVITALRWEAKVWTSLRWCKTMEIMHYMDISVYQ